MDQLNKLKEKLQVLPYETILQNKIITCPIYKFDLNNRIDPAYISQVCKKYQTENYKEKKFQSVYAWRSDYLLRHENHIPELEPLFKEVESQINQILVGPYKVVVDHYWFAIYSKGDNAVIHDHADNHFASVYYAKVPKKSAPLIIPSQNSEFAITPKEGNLVVFPGTCMHRVPVSEHENERIVIAINLLKYNTIYLQGENK